MGLLLRRTSHTATSGVQTVHRCSARAAKRAGAPGALAHRCASGADARLRSPGSALRLALLLPHCLAAHTLWSCVLRFRPWHSRRWTRRRAPAYARLGCAPELTSPASPPPPLQQAQHLARFLLQLYSLKAASASSPQAPVRLARLICLERFFDGVRSRQALFRAFTQLSSLAVSPDSSEAQLALAVQPLLVSAFVSTGRLRPDELAVEEIATVLAIEAANGFCIMAAADADGGRRIRGSGVYLKSSRINHGV